MSERERGRWRELESGDVERKWFKESNKTTGFIAVMF